MTSALHLDGPRSLAPVLLACLAWLLLLPAPRAHALPEVTGVRFGIDEHRTRVVLDLSEPVTYDLVAEVDPARLILDLEQVEWRLLGPEPTLRGLVRGHGFGPPPPGRSRLVVEMSAPFRIVGKIILPPSRHSSHHRLVIDLVELKAIAARQVPVPAPRPELAGAVPMPGAGPEGTELHDAAMAAALDPDLPVIVIDPGHGGADPGATAVDGAFEKDLVLEMARDLRQLIEGTGRYRVALTRDGDVSISLRDRITKARELEGRVFISLHADSLGAVEQRGASVYTLSEKASDAEAARLARYENKVGILTATDLSQHDAVVAKILLDLAQRDTMNRSIAFADALAEEMSGVVPMLRRYRRFAGFAVLKSPDIPSVLLELGFLSNPDDARNLAQPDYRATLSKAIVRAVDRFFAVPRT